MVRTYFTSGENFDTGEVLTDEDDLTGEGGLSRVRGNGLTNEELDLKIGSSLLYTVEEDLTFEIGLTGDLAGEGDFAGEGDLAGEDEDELGFEDDAPKVPTLPRIFTGEDDLAGKDDPKICSSLLYRVEEDLTGEDDLVGERGLTGGGVDDLTGLLTGEDGLSRVRGNGLSRVPDDCCLDMVDSPELFDDCFPHCR